MLHPNKLDDMLDKIIEKLPQSARNAKEGIDKALHEGLKAALIKLDIVTREEFDIQSTLLARCQEQLKALEEQLSKLK
jgi:BMFP domain-containing protein YqiC